MAVVLTLADNVESSFSVLLADIDGVTRISEVAIPDPSYELIIMSLPALGRCRVSEWVFPVMSLTLIVLMCVPGNLTYVPTAESGVATDVPLLPALLPYTITDANFTLTFTPTRIHSLQPALCNGRTSFSVIARNRNGKAPLADSPLTTITLQLGCNAIVCNAGEAAAQSSSHSTVCIACAAGTYNADLNSTCKPCPSGATCSGGASLAAQANFWQIGTDFHKCHDNRCCIAVS